MNTVISLLVPLIIGGTALFALGRRVDVYGALLQDVEEDWPHCPHFPAVFGLLTAVYMLRASGALELAVQYLSPLLHFLGLPPETAALMLVRPISGSGALGIGAELIQTFGPDSEIGRTAAVMLGSSESTFYTIAVYFGGLA